ncbi:hypothetical protein HYV88_03900 [Candidatus Woesearchaeota archaeon]|nr:hypothetical protein [Candidatus Woesearchaeota archaeon]
MRQFYVNKNSIDFMRTAYSTYQGSQVLTDYQSETINITTVEDMQNNKRQSVKLESKVSSAQVTTP